MNVIPLIKTILESFENLMHVKDINFLKNYNCSDIGEGITKIKKNKWIWSEGL